MFATYLVGLIDCDSIVVVATRFPHDDLGEACALQPREHDIFDPEHTCIGSQGEAIWEPLA